MDIVTIDKQGEKVRLDSISARPRRSTDRDAAKRELEALGEELFDLQDLLWGARMNSVLIVLQGRDTAGKDGTIKHVAGYLNPRGVHVNSFGVPTEEEREHDFLWRIHRHTPRKGELAIFNRSHYEDVLVVRVHGLVPESLWKERYGHIRDFEEMLAEHGTLILKFFLHISREEQEQRLLGPRAGAAQGLEDQRRRLEGPGALGRLHARLRGGHLAHLDEAGPVDDRPRGLQVVPQPRGGALPRRDAPALPRGLAGAGWTRWACARRRSSRPGARAGSPCPSESCGLKTIARCRRCASRSRP